MEVVTPTKEQADPHWLGHLRRLSSLRQFSPLDTLSDSHFMALVDECRLRVAVSGQTFQQDNRVFHCYLLHGTVECEVDGIVYQCEGGESFFAVLDDHVGVFTLRALSDIEYVQIDKATLSRLLTWSQVADYLHQQIALERDYDEDVDWMMSLLHSNLFLKVPPTQILAIFSLFESRVVLSGETILRQGEQGNYCYFIKEGRARVRREENGESFLIAEIGPGRCFGEDALVNRTTRNATVSMVSDGVLMCLAADDFEKLLDEPQVGEMSLAEAMEQATLIDVRTEPEYERWHLPKAVNLPLNLLAMKKRLLKHDHLYVCYCLDGQRSRAAAHLLRLQGLNVLALEDCQALLEESHKPFRQIKPHYLLQQGVAVPENT